MQLQNMCKKEHESPKVEGSGSSSSAPNDGEGDDNNDSGHVIGFLLWEDGGLHTFKLCRFSFRRWKDRSGFEKRKIWLSCFDE